jgi:type II secretory pathway component GspD/PulD (secretin)
VRSLIDKLDQPGTQNPSGNIHVVYLKNADATKLAATLRAAVTGEVRSPTNNPTLNNASQPNWLAMLVLQVGYNSNAQ